MLSATKPLKAGCFSAIILFSVFHINFHGAFVIVQDIQCTASSIINASSIEQCQQWWRLTCMHFSFCDKTKKFWALCVIFSDPACCSLLYRPSCLAYEILFMDSPTMGMLRPEPAAAPSFKTVYAKQKLVATIIKTSQHYRERALRWSSFSLQAPIICSAVPASGSHSLSAKQGRNKSTGKLTREKEDSFSAHWLKVLV